jgi:hypothetical protein
MQQSEPRTDWGKGEVPSEHCNHNNVHQFAGFNDFRNSQYKCEDCGAVEVVAACPQADDFGFDEVL